MIEQGRVGPAQIAVMIGICFDKMQIVNGDVTGRVEINHVHLPTVDDLMARAKTIQDKMAATEPKLKQANAIVVPTERSKAG